MALGALAAAQRGWVEELVMRASDFTFAFPALLSAIMLTAIYGPGLVMSIVAIGIFNIPVFARITRGAANAVWAREYVLAARAAGFGPEVRRRILIGTYVLSHGYYDAYYIKAQKIRRLIAQDFVEAFKHCDIIMGPTSPTTAFNLGEKGDDPVQMYLSDIYTIAVNLAGLPGMSIPCGFGDNGMAYNCSTDGGMSWEPAQLLIEDTDPRFLNDKNSMTADPNDPNAGAVV